MSHYIGYLQGSNKIIVADTYFFNPKDATRWIFKTLEQGLKLDNVKDKMRKSLIISESAIVYSVDGISCVITKIAPYKFKNTMCLVCLEESDPHSDRFTKFSKWKTLKCCNTKIHEQCMSKILKSCENCPSCKTCLINPDMRLPYGSMIVENCSSEIILNSEQVSTIIVKFHLRGGTTKTGYFPPEFKVAYFPDTPEGNELVNRFIHAFKIGILFKIGDSILTGRKNIITYTDISQKYDLKGYPDDDYIYRCLNELGSHTILGKYEGNLKLEEGNHKVFDLR